MLVNVFLENFLKVIRLLWNYVYCYWCYNELEVDIGVEGEIVCYFLCCENWDFDIVLINELFCNCKYEF